jgi:PAS domain S-box-containing protein
MTTEMRQTGIDVVGDIAWGTHCCLFYETKTDLLDTLVSYCEAGLDNHEFCLWVIAAPVTEEDAARALRQVVPDIDRYMADGSIEIVAARDWYLADGTFDLERVIQGWNKKLARALASGYAGVRVTGDTAWLERKDWKDFCDYEESLNVAIANQRLAVLCTYPLHACGAGEILDVVRTHQFAIAKRRGNWDVIETAGHKQAKREIKRLNEELEQRVAERTSQLTSVNLALTNEVLQRKRAEEAMRRSEAYLAEAQRLSHAGSWAFNTTGTVYWSEENFRIWGFDPQQGPPRRETVLQRLHPEDRDRVLEYVQKAMRERSDYVVEFRIVLPDGTVRHIHGLGHPFFDANGELVEVVGTQVDVTDRKHAEQEREKLHQLQADLARINRVSTMGELTASLAHEIKQPISAAVTDAKTCVRWLDRDQPDVAEAREAASRVVHDVTRAADIISRISLLFKKDALQRELVNFNELIREMAVLLHSEANRYSISVRTELAAELPHVMADAVQLQQVLMNLMLNGIDAMKDGSGPNELTIKSDADKGQLMISVSDTGAGLPPEHADQIFRAFFTTKDHGTGMGLPISRSIIESHGGRLWATGNAGRGATFQFSLPVSVGAEA